MNSVISKGQFIEKELNARLTHESETSIGSI
jgi:hypothetical protein